MPLDDVALAFWITLGMSLFAGVGLIVFRFGNSKNEFNGNLLGSRRFILVGTILALIYFGLIVGAFLVRRGSPQLLGCLNDFSCDAIARDGVNLRGADLRRVNLSGSSLRIADLSHADLTFVDLRGANLAGANLSDARLTSANLMDADLIGTNLRNAILNFADLSRASLGGADLSGARNLTPAQLDQACGHRRDAAAGPDPEAVRAPGRTST